MDEVGIDFLNYVPMYRGASPMDGRFLETDKNTINSFCYNYYERYIFHLKHWSILKDIKKKVNVDQFDCMHAHSLFSNGYIAYKLNQKYNVPYIVAVRNTDIYTFFKTMFHLRKIGFKILKNASYVVFLSQSYKEFLIDDYIPNSLTNNISKKCIVIPSGIDKFWFNNLRLTKKILNKKEICLLHVGDISKGKNLISTVKAIELLIQQGYIIKYTAVGKIRNKDIFSEIEKKTYFNYIERVKKEELLDIYKQNDILVVPSITETFGLVYPEAMSQGLPVIYTRGQGFDKHFEEGVIGYSVQANNPEEIAQRILDIVNNYELISKNCIEKVLKFQWDDIGLQYKKLYEKVVNS